MARKERTRPKQWSPAGDFSLKLFFEDMTSLSCLENGGVLINGSKLHRGGRCLRPKEKNPKPKQTPPGVGRKCKGRVLAASRAPLSHWFYETNNNIKRFKPHPTVILNLHLPLSLFLYCTLTPSAISLLHSQGSRRASFFHMYIYIYIYRYLPQQHTPESNQTPSQTKSRWQRSDKANHQLSDTVIYRAKKHCGLLISKFPLLLLLERSKSLNPFFQSSGALLGTLLFLWNFPKEKGKYRRKNRKIK